MQSRDYIFWEVDVQADFMLPGGKLFVPGDEKLLPNISKLTDAARGDQVLLFGVVTEYCVSLAVKGLLKRKRRVAVVQDAIETLDPEVGNKTLSELQSLGAKLVST